MVKQSLPEGIADRLAAEVDNLTTQLGAEPIRGPILSEKKEGRPSADPNGAAEDDFSQSSGEEGGCCGNSTECVHGGRDRISTRGPTIARRAESGSDRWMSVTVPLGSLVFLLRHERSSLLLASGVAFGAREPADGAGLPTGQGCPPRGGAAHGAGLPTGRGCPRGGLPPGRGCPAGRSGATLAGCLGAIGEASISLPAHKRRRFFETSHGATAWATAPRRMTVELLRSRRLSAAAGPDPGQVLLVRGGVLLPVDPDGLSQISTWASARRSGLLLDLADGLPRPVPGRALFRRAGGALPALGRRLPVGQARRLAGSVGWMAGWVYLACADLSLAAVALALQTTLPQICPLVPVDRRCLQRPTRPGTRSARLRPDRLQHADQRRSGVRLLARINNLGVFAELAGAGC